MRSVCTPRRPKHSREKSRAGRKNGASRSARIEGTVGDERCYLGGDGAAGLPGRRQLREGKYAGAPVTPGAACGRQQQAPLSAAARLAARAAAEPRDGVEGSLPAPGALSGHPPGLGPLTRTEGGPASLSPRSAA